MTTGVEQIRQPLLPNHTRATRFGTGTGIENRPPPPQVLLTDNCNRVIECLNCSVFFMIRRILTFYDYRIVLKYKYFLMYLSATAKYIENNKGENVP